MTLSLILIYILIGLALIGDIIGMTMFRGWLTATAIVLFWPVVVFAIVAHQVYLFARGVWDGLTKPR